MDEPYEVFFVTGEPSGDLHAAGLARQMAKLGDIRIEAVGGSCLQEAGAKLFVDSSDWGAIGVAQVLRSLPTYLRAMGKVVRRLKQKPPDILIPVDFGAFNLRLLKRLESSGLPPVFYYFPPGSWSRKARDNSDLARLVDRIATPFPWSERILKECGIDAHFVGHPVVERIRPPEDRRAFRRGLGIPEAEFHLGMMPGSRRIERRLLGPEFIQTARTLLDDGVDVHVLFSPPPSRAGEDDTDTAVEALGEHVTIIDDSARLVKSADLLLTAFGTATLEAAVALCPMICMYRGTWGMWLQFHLFGLSTDTYAMPNLIAGENIVPEMIDPQQTRAPALAERVEGYISEPHRLQKMQERLRGMREILDNGGAAQQAARLAWELL